MNWLDIVVIIGLALFTFLGVRRGLIKTALALAGAVVGVLLAGQYYVPFSRWLSHYIHQTNVAQVVAFALILIAVLVIVFVLARLLRRVASLVKLGWVDRLGGAIFGLAIGAVIFGALLAIFARFPFAGVETTIQESLVASVLLNHFPLVLGLLPEEFDAVRSFFQGGD